MSDALDGLTLIPAPDEPTTAGRHISLPGRRIMMGAAALARGAGFAGRIERKSMGGINAGPFLELAGQAITPLIAAAGGAAAMWLKGRADRRVKVKIGSFEAEAHSVAELEKVIKLAQAHREEPPDRV